MVRSRPVRLCGEAIPPLALVSRHPQDQSRMLLPQPQYRLRRLPLLLRLNTLDEAQDYSPGCDPRHQLLSESTLLLSNRSKQAKTDNHRRIECLTCLQDDIPISKSARLSCGHRMCNDCLKRIFTMSLNDPQHMPPRCCANEHIPLKHVEHLLSDKFKIQWNKKYQEYTTKNRVYCPVRGCGEWIKPSNIRLDSSTGRKMGRCSRCRTKVCCLCNGKWHSRKECPNDEDFKRFQEVAKEAGWQRCHNCKAMVELREGCNHMTWSVNNSSVFFPAFSYSMTDSSSSRCTAEFCMICGARWKTCDCPWFNYNPIPEDRLYHMNVPGQPEPMQVHYRRVPPNANPQPQHHAYNPRNPALNYQQEIDRRRAQERTDEQLARRLQVLGFANDDEVDVYGGGQGMGQEWGIGNAGGHFMNENYVRNAADLITAPYGHARIRGVDGGRGLDGPRIIDHAARAAQAAAAAAAAMAAHAPNTAHVNANPSPNVNVGGNGGGGGRRRGNGAADSSARGIGRTRSYSERAREIFGGRRSSSRRNSAAAAAAVERPTSQAGPAAANPGVAASMMAGLAMDGSRTGMGRVGTWLQHVVYDPISVQTTAAAR